MASYNLRVNGEARVVDVDPDTPMLYVLRDNLALKGPKFGCGLAQCGACVIHVDGEAARSCVLPVEAVKDRAVITLEGTRNQRETIEAPAGFHRRAGGAVRILRQRHDHDLRRAPGEEQKPQRIRHPRGACRQSLPLRHPSTHRRRCQARGGGLRGGGHDDAKRKDFIRPPRAPQGGRHSRRRILHGGRGGPGRRRDAARA